MASVYKKRNIFEEKPAASEPSPPPLPAYPAGSQHANPLNNLPRWQQILVFFALFLPMFYFCVVVPDRNRRQPGVSAVELGMSRSDVRRLAGEPSHTQEMRSVYGDSEYWYYGSIQICFDGDRVTSINRY